MKKLLLSTVFRPFGINDLYGRKEILAEFYHTNLTRGDGIFSIRGQNPNLGLHFIAENLEIPTKVLECPSLEEFSNEVRMGYDYVGVNFPPVAFEKARKLCEVAKGISPDIVTVVGGYGTLIPETEGIADHVCRGEGVRFMRNLLGEDPERPLRNPVLFNDSSELLGVRFRKGAGQIAAGLGCPNGCEFCLTSHYFKCRHLPFLKTGKEIYETMQRLGKDMPVGIGIGSKGFLIIEEDFLLDEKRVRELAEYTRKEIKVPLRFSCFGSAKAVSRYDPEELAEMGLDTVWIGVESKEKGYHKLEGIDMHKLFSSLHDHGIKTIGSMILGYDFHTPQALNEDVDYLISLAPTFNQFMLYTPLPGTPLYERYKKEGRILDLPWARFNGFEFTIKHPHFSPEEMEKMQVAAYEKATRELGPSVMRLIDVYMKGYMKHKDSKNPMLKKRAEIFRNFCRYAQPILPVVKKYAHMLNPAERINTLLAQIRREAGKFPIFGDSAHYFLLFNLKLKELKQRLMGEKVIQPVLIEKSYRL
ncbi:MAG: hypothetical protein RDV48_22340 [Candidatus Eremiobacteraeota bacterium]|nr:hypothetical protein [Candidatus Eremiobacteraeota bacterium]